MEQHRCKVACVQMNTTNDLDANVEQARSLIEEAIGEGAQLIALPENAFMMRASDSDSITLYPQEEHPGVQMCQALAKEHGRWILIGSVFAPCESFVEGDTKWYNRSILLNDRGEIAATYDKIHLFDAHISPDKRYQESARVMPGNQVRVADTPWGKIGMTICYDVRFPHMFRDLAKAGALIMAAPAAFAIHTGMAHWHVLLRARAIETGSFVIAPGQAGTHPGDKQTYGHSLIIGPWGEILAEGSAYGTGVIYAEIDIREVEHVRKRLPCLEHDRAYLGPHDYMI